jgi:glycosyltransferase involved in cell wall biosynthesis
MLDALIIRSPSPLAPYFKNSDSLKDKLVYMLVSDYKKGAEKIPVNNLRKLLVKNYVLHNDKKFKESIRNNLLIVNSSEIYNDHKHLSKSIFELRTTTLRNKDFYKRENQNLGNPIKILFTGRIVFQKGLINLIDCLSYSEKEGIKLELHIVGWEELDNKPFEAYLKTYAKNLNIKSQIIFHGLKSVGEELNAMYRMADIYVLPSHHEGFPRTIWEAMANSLPVISTNVGSIPIYLKNKKNALLVQPKDSNSLFEAIKLIISDQKLRTKLVENSLELVSKNTLELQTKKLIDIINKELNSISIKNRFE